MVITTQLIPWLIISMFKAAYAEDDSGSNGSSTKYYILIGAGIFVIAAIVVLVYLDWNDHLKSLDDKKWIIYVLFVLCGFAGLIIFTWLVFGFKRYTNLDRRTLLTYFLIRAAHDPPQFGGCMRDW
ncbi:putative integral membrane protein [Babesia bovis T2Bo]|uniref:putative integral membrane protein n=1 Tax=Babesia bovis T2Bo TaxID=484906 RepID=UPI001D624B5A|nr:putative integral membrane protein [Babesia bovis T2Bo]KAG6439910.1 putative integral membrane protein [Babesia bovis T2Bo]